MAVLMVVIGVVVLFEAYAANVALVVKSCICGSLFERVLVSLVHMALFVVKIVMAADMV
jgi:hypothetical protein